MNDELDMRWDKVQTHVMASSKKRNRLAHFNIMIEEGGAQMRRVGVAPSYLSPAVQLKMAKQKVRPLYLKDIENCVNEFGQVAKEVHALMAPA